MGVVFAEKVPDWSSRSGRYVASGNGTEPEILVEIDAKLVKINRREGPRGHHWMTLLHRPDIGHKGGEEETSFFAGLE